jgi:hypothetical protein
MSTKDPYTPIPVDWIARLRRDGTNIIAVDRHGNNQLILSESTNFVAHGDSRGLCDFIFGAHKVPESQPAPCPSEPLDGAIDLFHALLEEDGRKYNRFVVHRVEAGQTMACAFECKDGEFKYHPSEFYPTTYVMAAIETCIEPSIVPWLYEGFEQGPGLYLRLPEGYDGSEFDFPRPNRIALS